MAERYLDIHQVADMVGRSTQTIRRKVRAKEFPPPFKWSGGFAWLESEVNRWMVRNAVEREIAPEEMPEPRKKARDIVDNRGQSGTSAPEGAGQTGKPQKPR